jgi:hypothetical protein
MNFLIFPLEPGKIGRGVQGLASAVQGQCQSQQSKTSCDDED